MNAKKTKLYLPANLWRIHRQDREWLPSWWSVTSSGIQFTEWTLLIGPHSPIRLRNTLETHFLSIAYLTFPESAFSWWSYPTSCFIMVKATCFVILHLRVGCTVSAYGFHSQSVTYDTLSTPQIYKSLCLRLERTLHR